jgi:hypothetical protein
VVERQLVRQTVQGPPAGGAGVVSGGDLGAGGDDGRVGVGAVLAARVSAGLVPRADLAQVVGGDVDAGLLSQFPGGGLTARLPLIDVATLRNSSPVSEPLSSQWIRLRDRQGIPR